MSIPKLFGNLFLSAGAMKAGTTWLYAVMERHPDLHFTPEKEIHYFYHRYVNSDVLSQSRRLQLVKDRHLDGIDPKTANINRIRLKLHWVTSYLDEPVDDFWYRNLFSFPRKEKYACDFSNLHAQLPAEAWPMIAANCENLRVLYTLRHPLKRLWSHVKFHLQFTNNLEAMDDWRPADFRKFARQSFIWINAEYGEVLRKMKAGLSPEMLMVIFFEDLHADQRGTLADIEDFLGIRHYDYPDALLNRRFNESAPRPMPDFFPELFAKDIAPIIRQVEDQGLTIPDAWR